MIFLRILPVSLSVTLYLNGVGDDLDIIEDFCAYRHLWEISLLKASYPDSRPPKTVRTTCFLMTKGGTKPCKGTDAPG